MHKKILTIFSLASLVFNIARAEVPSLPSDVYVDKTNNTLIVQKPNDAPKPFIIKGVTYSPATAAPKEGPNPLDPSTTTPYGLFFDWQGRNPQGHEIFNYWLGNQFKEHYLTDIPLMKKMNINTVRIYNNLNDELTFRQILDEFYRNGIMVIMTVANSKDGLEALEEQFYVYSDNNSLSNHFAPSGWIGDFGDIIYNGQAGSPAQGENCIKINYSAAKTQANGWAGIYWQQPANNWGNIPGAGYNLTGAGKLTFWARGEEGGEAVEFKIGGINGQYGDSSAVVSSGLITLTQSWQKYEIDLSGKDLSYIIGGFCFAVTPPAKTFYIDEIRYEGYDIACQLKERHYENTVNLYKDHPAILMWAIGNEWNLNMFYSSYKPEEMTEAAAAVNRAAEKIKLIDSRHPVSSILGDKFDNANNGGCQPVWTIGDILLRCPNIDLWGLNIYRGNSFGSLFEEWKNTWQVINQLAKPFYISEFGIDSFYTTNYISDGSCPTRADNVDGNSDEQKQADIDAGLWNELKGHLSSNFPAELCLGGLVHEFNDELWKVGSYQVGLGGLVDYKGPDGNSDTLDDDSSYDEYNTEGFVLTGGSPDNVLNEEYFGLVNADRTTKKAYAQMRLAFDLSAPTTPGTPYLSSGTNPNNTGTFSLTWTASTDTGSGIKNYRVFRNNIFALGTVTTNSIQLTNLAEGSHTFTVYAYDNAGNVSTASPVSEPIVVDKTAPAITSVSDSPDAFNPLKATCKISYTTSDNYSNILGIYVGIYDTAGNLARSIVVAPQATGLNSVVWDGKNNSGTYVADGKYWYFIYARDWAGNYNFAYWYDITVDKTNPAVINISDSPDPFYTRLGQVSKISYALSDNLSPNLNVYCYIYTYGGQLVRTLGPYTQSLGVNSIIWDGKNSSGYYVSDGTYKYRLKAIDKTGNSVASGMYYVTKK